MSEKMLVTQALDERDLLVKKISDKIEKASFVDTIKPNEEKVYAGRCGKEEFAKDAQAAYQQITDLIDRFQKIDVAIVASNAKAEITTSYGVFTVAGAISLREDCAAWVFMRMRQILKENSSVSLKMNMMKEFVFVISKMVNCSQQPRICVSVFLEKTARQRTKSRWEWWIRM